MSEGSTDVAQRQAEVAETVRKFIENYDYYEAMLGQLRLEFEDLPDKRLIPGYTYDRDDIEEGPNERAKIDALGFTLGLYTTAHRETYYANWYGPGAGDHGEMPQRAEIAFPEEVMDDA